MLVLLPSLSIRLLARADGEALSSVRKWHIHHLAQLMAPGSESYCLVAWSGSDIIGWLDVRRKEAFMGQGVGTLVPEPLPAHGYISNVFVLEHWRRHGVARRLLVDAEYQVRRRGLSHVALTVEPGNAAAQRCYGSLGYELRGSAQQGMLWKKVAAAAEEEGGECVAA
eukprot:TRINITY_DN4174_c0_g1_i1.p1 TRINITY_DN4174_c0_g1~~TRINITY_DN4174_c0_g1_i1.p1  ORF type:complete len:168 (-),score=54.15 TRINITY_DN4174_c0_g1_i1:421-924(-)